jgi:gluconate 2-dehydrogenase subunit 3-like protein
MTISRRDALKSLGAVPFLRFEQPDDRAILAAIAEVVLPSEADRAAAVAAFLKWIADYKEGADTDHGYGNTRVRSTGPSPARNYPAQIAALDAAAKAKGTVGFTAATLDERRAIVEAAIAEAKVERLPARPTGAHVAADLLGHYFNSSAAADLCYRAAIGRDACRGLAGSEKNPAPLAPRVPRLAARASRLAHRS